MGTPRPARGEGDALTAISRSNAWYSGLVSSRGASFTSLMKSLAVIVRYSLAPTEGLGADVGTRRLMVCFGLRALAF